jgi:hypothetical protein
MKSGFGGKLRAVAIFIALAIATNLVREIYEIAKGLLLSTDWSSLGHSMKSAYAIQLTILLLAIGGILSWVYLSSTTVEKGKRLDVISDIFMSSMFGSNLLLLAFYSADADGNKFARAMESDPISSGLVFFGSAFYIFFALLSRIGRNSEFKARANAADDLGERVAAKETA